MSSLKRKKLTPEQIALLFAPAGVVEDMALGTRVEWDGVTTQLVRGPGLRDQMRQHHYRWMTTKGEKCASSEEGRDAYNQVMIPKVLKWTKATWSQYAVQYPKGTP